MLGCRMGFLNPEPLDKLVTGASAKGMPAAPMTLKSCAWWPSLSMIALPDCSVASNYSVA